MMRRDPDIQMLKENRSSAVWVEGGHHGQSYTIKCWSLSPWFAIKTLLGLSQPWRHWRGGRRLRNQNLASPEVLSVRPGWRGLRPVIRIRMPFITGMTASEYVGESPDSVDLIMAAHLGEAVSVLAHAGWRHRDLKLSNIVVQPDEACLWFIDPVGVVRDRQVVKATTGMLDRLGVEMRDGLVPHSAEAARTVVRSAIRGLSREDRRAVLKQLRRHH